MILSYINSCDSRVKRIHSTGERGNILVITLSVAVVLGSILASYLQLVNQQYLLNNRSQQWNLAVGVAEAGIEEALTQIHFTNDFTANGWTRSESGFLKKRELAGTGYTNRYSVVIQGLVSPVLISTGYVRMPNGTEIQRTIKVNTQLNSLFAKGMVAKGTIDFNGNNVKSDSFDSQDPRYSVGGRYSPTKVKDNGDVATNLQIVNGINVGNANIWGHVSTGPGGTVAVGAQGAVGSAAWQTNGNKGIEPGYISDDMNVNFPDVTLPFTGGAFTPTRKKVDGIWYDYVIDADGDWQLTSVSKSVIVKSNITARLLVTDSIQLTGQDGIILQGGSKLKLYMAGASAKISGKGIVNPNADAQNFFYYGLPTNTSLDLTGNGQFTGVIYAPQAAFALKGGGNNAEDFVGASITDSVVMNGHFNFHYDENLARSGAPRGFLITSWNEL